MNTQYILSKDGLVLCKFDKYNELVEFITHIDEYEITGVHTEDDLKKIDMHIYVSINDIKDNLDTYKHILKDLEETSLKNDISI